MRGWWFSRAVWLLSSGTGLGMAEALALPARAEMQGSRGAEVVEVNQPSPLQVGKAADLMAQGVTRVTGVKIERTAEGLELVLETAAGSERLVPLILPEGNDLVIDILDATLAFSIRNGVTELNPAPGINKVTVNKVDENSIRVRITGENQAPSAEVVTGRDNLVLSITTDGATAEEAPDEEIEIIVTGEAEDDDYYVPNASTATRTDTPIRDIPQSIQVVPRQVLDDRNVQRELEALETVSGVVDNDTKPTELLSDVAIRGFSGVARLRNGLRTESPSGFTPIGTIERVEVLRGPASVLFGALEPGGVVNFVTLQPLAEPYYRIEFEAGNYGFYQPSIDLSGPLTEDGSVLYRLIAAYQAGGDFKDSTPIEEQVISIAPSLTFKLGERTDLNIYYEYSNNDANFWFEPLLSDGSLIPKDVYPSYFSSNFSEDHRFGYTLNHEFGDSWQLRHNLSATFSTSLTNDIGYANLLEDRFLTDYLAFTADFPTDKYFGLIDLVGEFNTGSISHQLVAGFDYGREVFYGAYYDSLVDLPPLDIFDPNYDVPLPEIPSGPFNSIDINQSYGVYLQDQIAFTDNLKMLIGGRYDWLSNEAGAIDGDRTIQNDGAFSLGLFYVGGRQGDLENSFQIGDYLRTDAALYYRRGRFNAAINVRNLFDIDYVSSVSSSTLFINRGTPLTIVGSVSWEI